MPKGVYKRKPRTNYSLSKEGKAALQKNARKAAEARRKTKKMDSPEATEAKRKNAGTAVATRTARAILKHLPLGVKSGDEIQATRYRKIKVIDAVPVACLDGTWEQKFLQNGKITIYGQTHEFSGACRIVWHEKPTLETILERPLFEEIE